MKWEDVAVTEEGIEMLNASLIGETLTLDSADGGTGLMDVTDLSTATDVVDKVQDLTISSLQDVSDGKKVGVQISNANLEAGYILHQIGVFAKLPDQKERKLLMILQDEEGTEIPARTEETDFLLEIYAVISVSNEANIVISLESSVYASVHYVDEKCEELHSDSIDVTLKADGWEGDYAPYLQTVEVPGLTADRNAIIGLSSDASIIELSNAMNAGFYVAGQGDETITVGVFSQKPDVDIPASIILIP